MSFFIGIDLGASHVKAVAVTPEGEALGRCVKSPLRYLIMEE